MITNQVFDLPVYQFVALLWTEKRKNRCFETVRKFRKSIRCISPAADQTVNLVIRRKFEIGLG